MLDCYIQIIREFLIEVYYVINLTLLYIFKLEETDFKPNDHKQIVRTLLNNLSELSFNTIRVLFNGFRAVSNETSLFHFSLIQIVLSSVQQQILKQKSSSSQVYEFRFQKKKISNYNQLMNHITEEDLLDPYSSITQIFLYFEKQSLFSLSYKKFISYPLSCIKNFSPRATKKMHQQKKVQQKLTNSIQIVLNFIHPLIIYELLYKKCEVLFKKNLKTKFEKLFSIYKSYTDKEGSKLKHLYSENLILKRKGLQIKHINVRYQYTILLLEQSLIYSKINKISTFMKKKSTSLQFDFSKTNDNTTLKTKNEKNYLKFYKSNTEEILQKEINIHNPLKLPLGWDNKPIPFWLFKQHGLNEIFYCEVCGQKRFYGRKSYEKHFFENRHINNLNTLGITDYKKFKEISSIKKVLDLFKYNKNLYNDLTN
mmetsp:Transcript_14281/g.19867  ORF Transcript_14281/g.19867 Transcript_14281/m.19867 type:complete len:425 (+) Transcript_14281:920-2194(+)